MADFLLDNFWLILYIGVSQSLIVDFAARNNRSLGLIACLFMLVFAPFWPLATIYFLFQKR